MHCMTTSRKLGFTLVLGVALALGTAAAPAASAEPVKATTLTTVFGSGGGATGSAGYGGALVNEAVSVSVDAERPGFSAFHSSLWCGCVVNWTNLSTGASGSVTLPIYPELGNPDWVFPWTETGSGRIVAVVTASEFTYLPGVGTWTVP